MRIRRDTSYAWKQQYLMIEKTTFLTYALLPRTSKKKGPSLGCGFTISDKQIPAARLEFRNPIELLLYY